MASIGLSTVGFSLPSVRFGRRWSADDLRQKRAARATLPSPGRGRPVQLRFETDLTAEEHVRREEWRNSTPPCLKPRCGRACGMVRRDLRAQDADPETCRAVRLPWLPDVVLLLQVVRLRHWGPPSLESRDSPSAIPPSARAERRQSHGVPRRNAQAPRALHGRRLAGRENACGAGTGPRSPSAPRKPFLPESPARRCGPCRVAPERFGLRTPNPHQIHTKSTSCFPKSTSFLTQRP